MASFSKPAGVKSACIFAGATCLSAYALMLRMSAHSAKTADGMSFQRKQTHVKQRTPTSSLDLEIFSKILRLYHITVPNMHCKEFVLMVFTALTLVLRTWIDIWIISNNTAIESAIVGIDAYRFSVNLFNFIVAIPMVSFVNATIKFSLETLKGLFFERLSDRFRSILLRDRCLYQLAHLYAKDRDISQIMVSDLKMFSSCIVDMLADFAKPSMTIVVCFVKLVMSVGPKIPLSMLLYLILSGMLVTRLRNPSIRLNREERIGLDQLHNFTSKLVTNSEQIAFYGGEKREASSLKSVTNAYCQKFKATTMFRYGMDIIDQAMAKYFATVVGFALAGHSVLYSLKVYQKIDVETQHAQRLKKYYGNGRVLIKMASSVGRLVIASRQVTKLVIYTNRIIDIHDLLLRMSPPNQETLLYRHSSPTRCIEIRDKYISFENVPITTPDGNVLIKSFNLQIPQGVNILIVGPNGCGKSSMFRILGELWPLQSGKIVKPPKRKLFYIPQAPYMPDGTLLDQIIYPDTKEEALTLKNVKDADLIDLLEKVDLLYLLERGGWDARCDWSSELSGGEKQRLAMARLLYHKPQFAILDECTSAVSVDIEGSIYSLCKKERITLLTVSHRSSLLKFHDYCLTISPDGYYSYEKIQQC